MAAKWFGGIEGELSSSIRAVREFLYGFTVREMDQEAKKEKVHEEHIFMTVVFGDLIGLPLPPQYYRLRILPHILPKITAWKHAVLKPKDLTDAGGIDI
jgi:hypothetical protein